MVRNSSICLKREGWATAPEPEPKVERVAPDDGAGCLGKGIVARAVIPQGMGGGEVILRLPGRVSVEIQAV